MALLKDLVVPSQSATVADFVVGVLLGLVFYKVMSEILSVFY